MYFGDIFWCLAFYQYTAVINKSVSSYKVQTYADDAQIYH